MTERVPTAVLDAAGLACVSVTPLVKKTIKAIDPGAVLEVRTDDPAAREGIPAWCRLTRNELLETIEHDHLATTFLIEHTPAAENEQSVRKKRGR